MDPLLATMAGFVFLLAGCYLYLRPRSQAAAEPVRYRFRCPGCRQPLRFCAGQVGKRGQCRRCKQRLVFPNPNAKGVKELG
jgi:hypothetical protein